MALNVCLKLEYILLLWFLALTSSKILMKYRPVGSWMFRVVS